MADKKPEDKKNTPKIDPPDGGPVDPSKVPPASESNVSHAHELMDEEQADLARENNAEAQVRRAGDPLGRAKEARDRDEADEEAAATVRKRKASRDSTRVTMIRTVDAPHVGGNDVRRLLGVTTLQQGKSYDVPANVAAVLVDHKAAIVPE